MSVAIILVLLHFGESRAVPIFTLDLVPNVSSRSVHINESTGLSAPAWTPDPSGRGTHNLISSCVTTLVSCAYTAVHLNIHPEHSKIQSFVKRVSWMGIAVLAPEVVLWCAFEQLRAARQLRDEINRVGQRVTDGDLTLQNAPENCPCAGSPADSINSPLNHLQARPSIAFSWDPANKPPKFMDWNLSQAFYAISGGFAVDSSLFWTQNRITLTPAGILEIVKFGLLPSISAEDVEDKSKADSFAKIVVVLQIVYFSVQSVSRLIDGLPLTLLEIHTLTHVACALLIYGFWFPKPFNVHRPTLCTDERIIDLAALFTLDRGQYYGNTESYACCQRDEITIQNLKSIHIQSIAPSKVLPLLTRANRALDRLRDLGLHLEWSLTADKAMGFRKCLVVHTRKNYRIEGKPQECDPERTLDLGLTPAVNGYWVLPLIAGCYGGVHLSAWTAHFPTVVEMWIWRAAGLAVVLTTILHFIWVLCVEVVIKRCFDFTKEMSLAQRIVAKVVSSVGWTAGLLSVYTTCLYPFARLYFVVESVASLRAPPLGTWETTDWTGLVPHFS